MNESFSINPGTSLRVSNEKGRSFIHKFRYLSSWHIRGLDGSMVIGKSSNGGSHSPTLPSTDKESLAILSNKVSDKFLKTFTNSRVLKIYRWRRVWIITMTFKISLEILKHGINIYPVFFPVWYFIGTPYLHPLFWTIHQISRCDKIRIQR